LIGIPLRKSKVSRYTNYDSKLYISGGNYSYNLVGKLFNGKMEGTFYRMQKIQD
jgi:hypothetical protein